MTESLEEFCRKGEPMYERYGKRLIDILLSLGVLIFFSPLYIILMVLIALKLGRPVFFSQERPGREERLFRLYKFRTMTDARDEKGDLLPDRDRLTPFGKTLRRLSLDELPEFYNILKGDMSLIGPRPLLPSYLPYYRGRERIRHRVRPGLTGLAQVHGRNLVDWDRRLSLDADYVENISLLLDLKIVFWTIQTLFIRRDQVAEDTGAVEGNLARIRSKEENMRK